jgi:hypothetical protein
MNSLIAAGGLAIGADNSTIHSTITGATTEAANNGWNEFKDTVLNLSIRPGDVKENWKNYLQEVADRGDLSSAEKHLYGIVYGVSEAMMPESELEIALGLVGGAVAGKAIKALVKKYEILGLPVSEAVERAVKEWKSTNGGKVPTVSGGKPITSGGTANAATTGPLNDKLTVESIANGHAFDKHIGEFKDLGISTREQFHQHIENIVKNPTHSGSGSGGKYYYYDEKTNTLVIKNLTHPDKGTAFIIDKTRHPDPFKYIQENIIGKNF